MLGGTTAKGVEIMKIVKKEVIHSLQSRGEALV